jgi:hypothetical protein
MADTQPAADIAPREVASGADPKGAAATGADAGNRDQVGAPCSNSCDSSNKALCMLGPCGAQHDCCICLRHPTRQS